MRLYLEILKYDKWSFLVDVSKYQKKKKIYITIIEWQYLNGFVLY